MTFPVSRRSRCAPFAGPARALAWCCLLAGCAGRGPAITSGELAGRIVAPEPSLAAPGFVAAGPVAPPAFEPIPPGTVDGLNDTPFTVPNVEPGESLVLDEATATLDPHLPAPLELQQAIQQAHELNPRLRALRARVGVAKAEEAMAFAEFLPRASFAFRDIGGTSELALPTLPSEVGNAAFGGTSDLFQTAELNMQWTLWDFGRIAGRHGQARMAEEIAQLQYCRGTQAVTFDVTASYFRVLERAATRRIADEAVRRAEALVRDAGNYRREGTAIGDDVLQAAVLLSQMQLDLVGATTAETVSVAELNRAVGWRVGDATRIVDRTDEPPFLLSLEDCLRRAVAERFEIQIIQRAIRSSQMGLDVARADFLPEVVAGGTDAHYNLSDTGGRHLLFGGVRIEMGLFAGGKRIGEMHRQEAKVREAVAKAQEVSDAIASEVIAAYAGVIDARQRIALSRTAVVQATESLRVLRELYGQGDAIASDVIDAELSLVRAQQGWFAAVYGYQVALAKLEYSIGATIPPIPPPDP